jgi:hypothetical protein
MRNISYALIISASVHALLIWLAVHPQHISQNVTPIDRESNAIHITLKYPQPSPSLPKQSSPSRPSPLTRPLPARDSKPTTQKPNLKPNKPNVVHRDKQKQKVTSAKILGTVSEAVKEVTQQKYSQETQNTGLKEKPPILAPLDKALNPRREAPNITVRSDGTTRVVTKSGTTYCIKPLEDWKIIDPNDDIRTSTTCN